MSEARDFNSNPRRVVVAVEFYVYDDTPVVELEKRAKAMVEDEYVQELVLDMFADRVVADCAVSKLDVVVHV